jgi:hypothetical protein
MMGMDNSLCSSLDDIGEKNIFDKKWKNKLEVIKEIK